MLQLSTTITLADWKEEMTRAIQLLEDLARDGANPLQKVVLRPAHANANKRDILACPARDFRSLPNANEATMILREIAQDFSQHDDIVSFVDTSFIIDPVWDSATD